MSSVDNQDTVSNELLCYALELEKIILDLAKYDTCTRKIIERKIKNLAQLSINKGINIEEIAKDLNQEKKNDQILDKSFNDNKLSQYNNNKDIEKDINIIEMKDISNQIFCKDFYRNLLKFMQRKKDALKISNLMNNSNKIMHTNNNIMQNKYNKYQMEQNNIYDNNNSNLNDSGKSASKTLGRKRKFK